MSLALSVSALRLSCLPVTSRPTYRFFARSSAFETNHAGSRSTGREDFQSDCFLTPMAGMFSSLGHFHASEGDERSIASCATCFAKLTMLSWSFTVPLPTKQQLSIAGPNLIGLTKNTKIKIRTDFRKGLASSSPSINLWGMPLRPTCAPRKAPTRLVRMVFCPSMVQGFRDLG